MRDTAPLIAEAGTGVGKSLAYLVPAVLHGLDSGRKAILSTHTINLQEQLIAKDIPILQKVLDREFSAVLLKGRGNYLCPNRLQRTMEAATELLSSSEQEELKMVWDWSHETRDGTLSDLDFAPSPAVWTQVCSESHVCNPKICGTGDRCFYQATRKRAAEADVLVLNHTLFFTLLPDPDSVEVAEGSGFLFGDDFVIFDEAHSLEAVAARQLGMRLSHSGLRYDLYRLYNPRRKKGLFQLLRFSKGISEVAALLDQIDDFFDSVENACRFSGYSREFRVREPELVDNTLGAGLFRLQELVKEVAERTDSEPTKLELGDLGRRLAAARTGLGHFLDVLSEEDVYWVEKRGQGQFPISLNSAPVDVAGLLREDSLWARKNLGPDQRHPGGGRSHAGVFPESGGG